MKGRRPNLRPTFCASLRTRNAHGHVTRAIVRGNYQEKCHAPDMRRTFCASRQSRNVHGHITRASLWRKIAGKMRQTKTATSVLCEPPAQWKCTWTNHRAYKSHLMREFTERKPEARLSTLIQYPHRKNPSVWTHCWEKNAWKSTNVRVSLNRDT